MGIKAIARLIPIIHHLCKLSGRNQLRTATFSYNYRLKKLLERRFAPQHHFSLENITTKQWITIKSSVVNTNNYLNGIFPSFDTLNREFHSRNKLVDFFSDCFSFHKVNYSSKESKSHYCSHLNNIVFTTSSNPTTVIVISDVNIKNNVTTSITYIHSFNNPLKKTLYHTINITSTEVELFAIRCRIN